MLTAIIYYTELRCDPEWLKGAHVKYLAPYEDGLKDYYSVGDSVEIKCRCMYLQSNKLKVSHWDIGTAVWSCDARALVIVVVTSLSFHVQCLHCHTTAVIHSFSISLHTSFDEIQEKMTNENRAAPYCIEPRLKQDIRLMFVSNYFVFRWKILQRATLIIIITYPVVISTLPGSPKGLFEFSNSLDPRSIVIHHGSIQTFLVDKINGRQRIRRA